MRPKGNNDNYSDKFVAMLMGFIDGDGYISRGGNQRKVKKLAPSGNILLPYI